jgi:hypothetical protein
MFAERVRQLDDTYPGYAAAWGRLATVVLGHGGIHVVPPLVPDILVDVLSEQGKPWAADVRHLPGQASSCHDNSIELWRSGEAASIGTGYALSDDGLWREHSWAATAEGVIIETTEPRARYFGLDLSGDEAEGFARWIDGGDPPTWPAFAR